jgi:hypothetical protein
VACECVVLAETKDHLDWELIHQLSENANGERKESLKAAYEKVEEKEDEYLYHTRGSCASCGSILSECLPCCHRPRKGREEGDPCSSREDGTQGLAVSRSARARGISKVRQTVFGDAGVGRVVLVAGATIDDLGCPRP